MRKMGPQMRWLPIPLPCVMAVGIGLEVTGPNPPRKNPGVYQMVSDHRQAVLGYSDPMGQCSPRAAPHLSTLFVVLQLGALVGDQRLSG